MLAICFTSFLTKNSCGELRIPEVVALGSLMCVNLLSFTCLGCLAPLSSHISDVAVAEEPEAHWAEKSEAVVPSALRDDLSVVSLEQPG